MYHHSKKKKLFFFIPIIVITAILLFGGVVMFLWNAILPATLHTEELSYIQAIGLLILCRILFGGFLGKYNSSSGFKRGMYCGEKWNTMTDEDKAKFKEQWRIRCGRSKEVESKTE